MSRRDAARETTRRRIVEATVKLHGERGVFGTSYADIAAEADVAVATVYKHFPSVDDLLPACGALVMDRARPPRAEDAAQIVAGETTTRGRLRRVADELFAYYERGGPHLEVDAQERRLPGMREWEESQRATVTALVREALAGERVDRRTVQLAAALFDLATFKAFRVRGVSRARAAEAVADAAELLARDGRSKRSRRKEAR